MLIKYAIITLGDMPLISTFAQLTVATWVALASVPLPELETIQGALS
jgi:hypothetical protein